LIIKLNGETLTVEENVTVAGLLASLKKDPKFLAVEVNRELVPRTQHADCQLSEGDDVEIVTLVGGG
jgi:sulfur carrier protein